VLQALRSRSLVIWAIVFVCFVVGFLLVDTSGLLGLGSGTITPTTAVATVNGTDIQWLQWQNLANNRAAQEERNLGRGLTLDERARFEDQAFEELVSSVLLQQEYSRRGIVVSDQEIQEAARQSPPPELLQNPELQTDGRFDMEKYRRLLNSAAARQQGLLLQLESFYRSELPRVKLFNQLSGDVFVSDDKLWSTHRDQTDSAEVSFVAFESAGVTDSNIVVPESDLRSYYDRNKAALERPGRATISVLAIPRTITSSDSQATRARAVQLKNEIAGGARFEDVARRESGDTVSGQQGGSLGTRAATDYVEAFRTAALAMRTGTISDPVLSEFGYHLIRKEGQKGDSLTLSHILLRIAQSDSSATRTDRRADSLSRIAGGSDQGSQLDSAAKRLGLRIEVLNVIEGQPAFSTESGRMLPGISAWAFSGPRVGEISDLQDSEDVYVLARLDTLADGGIPSFAEARGEVSRLLIGRKRAESLLPRANELVAAVNGADLESAAKARDIPVQKSPLFTRAMFVPGLGRFNEAIGAAFSLPVGQVSKPIVTDQGVFVIRVDRRIEADRAAWEANKNAQRTEAIAAIRQLRIRTYMSELRKSAKVTDNRKRLNAAARAQAVE
jgi:peptidyl-prolyl cis-trans isomerase D